MNKLVPLFVTLFISITLRAQSEKEQNHVNFLKAHGVIGFFLQGDDLNRMMRAHDPFAPFSFPALVITSMNGPAVLGIPTLDSKKYLLANGQYDENKAKLDKQNQLKKPATIRSQFLILHDEAYREQVRTLMSEGYAVAITLSECSLPRAVTLAPELIQLDKLAKHLGHDQPFKGFVVLNGCADYESLLHESYHLYQYAGDHGVSKAEDVLNAFLKKGPDLGIHDQALAGAIFNLYEEIEASRYAMQIAKAKDRKSVFAVLRVDPWSPTDTSTYATEIVNPPVPLGLDVQTRYMQTNLRKLKNLIEDNWGASAETAAKAIEEFFAPYVLPKTAEEEPSNGTQGTMGDLRIQPG